MPEEIIQQQQPQPQVQQVQKPQYERYQKVERSFGRMLVNNFFGGIFWSLGVLVGASILIGIAAYFTRKIDFVPIFGHFFAEILKSAQGNLQPTATPIP